MLWLICHTSRWTHTISNGWRPSTDGSSAHATIRFMLLQLPFTPAMPKASEVNRVCDVQAQQHPLHQRLHRRRCGWAAEPVVTPIPPALMVSRSLCFIRLTDLCCWARPSVAAANGHITTPFFISYHLLFMPITFVFSAQGCQDQGEKWHFTSPVNAALSNASTVK